MSMICKGVLPGSKNNNSKLKKFPVEEIFIEYGDGSTIKELLLRRDNLIAPMIDVNNNNK